MALSWTARAPISEAGDSVLPRGRAAPAPRVVDRAGAPVARRSGEPRPPVRVFFISDVHSDHGTFERFVGDANRERPDLVIDGGDLVDDGTWPEFRTAFEIRDRLEPPWHGVKGNHDAQRRGSFPRPPPDFPEFEAFSHQGVRFILLDNHQAVLTEEQFEELEADLEANQGQPIVVVMHVPPIMNREPFMTRLRHLIPLPLASPTMRDPDQVERFTDLMARHDVLAVLSGHAHVPDDFTVDGVRYLLAAPAGGLAPGLRIPREYLDIEIDGREVRVERVRLGEPAGDPVTFVARAFRFVVRLNSFNRAELGWSFVPSASVQWKGGIQETSARGGGNAAAAAFASFEYLPEEYALREPGRWSAFGDVGLTAAPREVAGHFVGGYKVRPLGGYNRSVFVGVGGSLNAGMIRGSGTAGVGARAELGVEWRGVTASVTRNWATNHRSTGLWVGRRY